MKSVQQCDCGGSIEIERADGVNGRPLYTAWCLECYDGEPLGYSYHPEAAASDWHDREKE